MQKYTSNVWKENDIFLLRQTGSQCRLARAVREHVQKLYDNIMMNWQSLLR